MLLYVFAPGSSYKSSVSHFLAVRSLVRYRGDEFVLQAETSAAVWRHSAAKHLYWRTNAVHTLNTIIAMFQE